MTKQEFLEILRQSLVGEVNSAIIEQNIQYYDQYITSQSAEKSVIESLGDPRLIAKTIIETNKVAKQKDKFAGARSNYSEFRAQEDQNSNSQENNKPGANILFPNLKWYHKLTIALVIILALIVIIFIGRIIIGFLFAFIVPIAIVLMLLALFRKR